MAKYCTRCNKGIYTAWRTLDNKKYYHPHCFTCAVCNVILECVQECGIPNLKEIYCKKCYKDCLRGEKINKWYETPKNTTSGKGQGEELMQLLSFSPELPFEVTELAETPVPAQAVSQSQPAQVHGIIPPPPCNSAYQDGQAIRFGTTPTSNVPLLHEKQQPFPPQLQHLQNAQGNLYPINPDLLAAYASIPPPPVPKKRSSSSKPSTKHQLKTANDMAQDPSFIKFVQDKINNNNMEPSKSSRRLERKHSRIPRPTSSTHSKKLVLPDSTPPESSLPRMKSKTKAKSSSNNLTSSGSTKILASASRASNNSNANTNGRSRPPLPARMQRSISLVQQRPKASQGSTKGQLVNTKSSKSFGRSATMEEPYTPPPRIPQQIVSKRQCAASFSNSRNNTSFQQRNSQEEQKQPSSTSRRTSEMYVQNQAYFKQTKMEVPTPQAILSALRRERPDVNINKTSTTTATVKTKDDENGNSVRACTKTFVLPKRNFNITFDCPICISSLVPGTAEANNTKGARGNVVTICGHLFHRECMENWLKMKGNKRCPICSALCLPETLQPVYLECNVSAEVSNSNSKQGLREHFNYNQPATKLTNNRGVESAYSALRYEYDQLKRKYNSMLQDKNNYSLNVTIANSLQSAYDMECRNRLQLQWENKKLQQQIQELMQDRPISEDVLSRKFLRNQNLM